MKTKRQSLTIEYFLRNGYISQTTFNVCGRNKLNTFDQILSHYNVYGTFMNLHWLGVKTDNELRRIINSADFQISQPVNDETLVLIDNNIDVEQLYINLDDLKKKVFHSFFTTRFALLSTRALNLLAKIKNLNDVEAQIELIFHHDFSLGKIRSLGTKTHEIIHKFKQEISSFLTELTAIETLTTDNIIYLQNKYRFTFYQSPLLLLSESKLEILNRKIYAWIHLLPTRTQNILFDIQEIEKENKQTCEQYTNRNNC